MPSIFSLIRLVPTVTVLAWCLMASMGRAMMLMDSPRHLNRVSSMLRAVPFRSKSISKSVTGRRPGKVFEEQGQVRGGVEPHGEGDAVFVSFLAEGRVELGHALPEALLQNHLVDIQAPFAASSMASGFLPEIHKGIGTPR